VFPAMPLLSKMRCLFLKKLEPIPPSHETFCSGSVWNLPRAEVPVVGRALDIGCARLRVVNLFRSG
jgi:hypothetical protein